MDRALEILQNFAMDVRAGKVSKDKLRFGAPWRHPPQTEDPTMNIKWAKLQLMDFVQSLVNTEFGVNLLISCISILSLCKNVPKPPSPQRKKQSEKRKQIDKKKKSEDKRSFPKLKKNK